MTPTLWKRARRGWLTARLPVRYRTADGRELPAGVFTRDFPTSEWNRIAMTLPGPYMENLWHVFTLRCGCEVALWGAWLPFPRRLGCPRWQSHRPRKEQM